jgi:integrase/recombinase XerD
MQPALKKNDTVGKNALIKYFAESLKKKNNYPQIAKSYLNFICDKNFALDEISLKLFLRDKPASYHSPCKKLLAFAQSLGYGKVFDDTEQKKDSGKDPAVNIFLENLQIRNSSKETYGKAMKELRLFLSERELPLNRAAVIEFFNHMIEKKSSPYTLNTYLSVYRKFAGFCISEREKLNLDEQKVRALQDILLLKNYRNKIQGNGYTKDALNAEERAHLLSVIDNPRDKAIIALMALQGLRSIEVLRLEWKDIVLKKKNYYLAVLGKGALMKETVPLTNTCLEILMTYKKSLQNPSERMFDLSETRSIRSITSKWFKIAGLAREKLSAHSLRHTTAQILVFEGVPKEMVKRFLRHQSELSTGVYTRKAEDEIFLKFDFETLPKTTSDENSTQQN